MEEFTQNLATSPTISRFLELPVDILNEVVDHLSPSEIKVLCLVSKGIWDLATQRLYNRVDLTSESDQNNNTTEDEGKMLARVSSLLSAPSNLRFIRILNTGCFGLRTTEAIDALLPQLKENALIEFHFSADKKNFFPTSEQLHLLWSRQERLQNLQLCTHHILDFFEQTQEPPNCLPKSIIRLGLANEHWLKEPCSDVMLLPLKTLDLSRLRSLTLTGAISSNVVSCLSGLFASRSFSTLTDLHVEEAIFEETLELSNLPSLDLLSFGRRHTCFNYRIKNKALVVLDDFSLRKIFWVGLNPVHHQTLETVLGRVEDLEHLEIEAYLGFDRTVSSRTVLAEAIELHKSTLKTLLIDELIMTESLPPRDPSFEEIIMYGVSAFNGPPTIEELEMIKDPTFDEGFLRRILMCKQLEVLSLPLPPNQPVAYYTNIIASLPRLREFRIYDCDGVNIDATEPRIVELVEAVQNFSRIKFFAFSENSYPVERRRSRCWRRRLL